MTVKIIQIIRDILGSRKNTSATSSAFRALRTIYLTIYAGEESSVVESIPLLLSTVEERTFSGLAMAALAPLPYVNDYLSFSWFSSEWLGQNSGHALFLISAKWFRKACWWFGTKIQVLVQFESNFTQLSAAIDEDGYSVLRGLLLSIPTFWGSGEVKQVVTLFIDQYSSPNTSTGPLASLVKTVPKKVPSKVLVPAMIDMWSFVQTTFQPVRRLWSLILLMIMIVHPRVVLTRISKYWPEYCEAQPGRRSSRIYAPCSRFL